MARKLEEEPVALTARDVGVEEPVALTARDVGVEEPVALTAEEAAAADGERPGFLRKAAGAVAGQVREIASGAAAGVARDLPRMLWRGAALVLPGETPSAENPSGKGAAGFAGSTADFVDAAEESASWDDRKLKGVASVPGMAARSLAPNLLVGLATGGAGMAAMPFLYGGSRAQEMFARLRDKAQSEGKPFDAAAARLHAAGAGALEGGLEYVSNLFGVNRQIRSLAAGGGKEVAASAAKGIARGLRKLAASMTNEAGTEFVQEGGGELHEQLLGISDSLEKRPETLAEVNWDEVWNRAALAAAAGALSSRAVGAIEAAARRAGAGAEARAADREDLAGSVGAAEFAAGESPRVPGVGGRVSPETTNPEGGAYETELSGAPAQRQDEPPGAQPPAEGEDTGGVAPAAAAAGPEALTNVEAYNMEPGASPRPPSPGVTEQPVSKSLPQEIVFRGDAVNFGEWDKSKGELIAFTSDRNEAQIYSDRRTSERYKTPGWFEENERLAKEYDNFRRTHPASEWDHSQEFKKYLAHQTGSVKGYSLQYGKLATVEDIRDAMWLKFDRWLRENKQIAQSNNELVRQAKEVFDPSTQLSGLYFWQKTTNDHKDVWSKIMSPFLQSLGYDGIQYTEDNGGVTKALFASGRGRITVVPDPPDDIRYNMEPGASPSAPESPIQPGPTQPSPGFSPHTVYGQSSGGAGAAATRAPALGEERGAVGMDLRDAVEAFRDLSGGKLPKVKERLRARNALGLFRSRPGATAASTDIELLASLFGLYDPTDAAKIREDLSAKGYEGAALDAQVDSEVKALVVFRRNEPQKRPVKVLLHELAHLADFLPEGNLARGNILGHIAAMRSAYRKQFLGAGPGKPGPLTAEERRALEARARREMREKLGEARTVFEEVTREVPEYRIAGVDPDAVLALLGERAGADTPEMYGWFAQQDSITKREILTRAMKGVVDERLAGFGRREQTGTRTVTERVAREVPGYTAADGARRFKELLREEVARRQLIELAAVKAEAREFIPWWRGAGDYETYFDKPAEMYAELFGAFLADPDAVKERAPTAFRAFAGWMAARPEVQRVYNSFQEEKRSGAREARHAANLTGEWERKAQDDLRKVTDELKKPSGVDRWMGVRYTLDRRLGPYETAVARSYKTLLEGAESDADRARLKARYERALGMKKEYLHVRGVIREFDTRVYGGVDKPLKAAGLDWLDLAEYKFHRRVAWELDGKAAPRGWAPDTSLRRLEDMRRELGDDKWAVLERAGVEFRAAFEQTVIQNPYVRKMLGPELIALMEKNVEYVTFEHVPTREQVAAFRAKLKAGDKKGAKALLQEEGLDWLAQQMEGRFGDSVSPHIYRFKGSFDPVRDPLTATMRKAEAIIKSAYLNELKIMLRDMATESGFESVQPVPTVRDPYTNKQRPAMIDGNGWKTVLYMENGELKGYKASTWLAKALDPSTADMPDFARSMLFVNRFIANLYTTMNIAFMEPAFERDKQSATENVEGLTRAPLVQYVPVVGKLLGMVTRYIPERYSRALPRWIMNDSNIEWWEPQGRRAAILIASGDFSAALAEADRLEAAGNRRAAELRRGDVALARAGLTKGVLMPSIEAIKEMYGVTDADLIWHRSGIRKADFDEAAGVGAEILGFFRGVGERLAALNEIRENTTKLATLSFLMNKTGMSEDQMRLIVTDFGGSPDFSERSAWAAFIEFALQPFMGARKEAAVRNVRAFADHPADWLAKKSAYVIGPAALRWLLYSGAALAFYKHWVPDEEERENNPMWRLLKWFARHGANTSDYLLKNYITTPLPVNTGNPECSVLLTMPMDQTDQVVSTLVWNALDAAAGAAGLETSRVSDPLGQSLGTIKAEFLPSIESQSPVWSSLWMIGNFMQGNNYFDAFRHRNVFTGDELRKRFTDPAGGYKLAGELWNRAGGAMLWRYQSNDGLPQPGSDIPLADFMRLPVAQSTLGRYIRIVHNGRAQAAARISDSEQDIKAGTRLELRRLFSGYVSEGYNWTPEIQRALTRNPYASEYWQNMNQRYRRELAKNPAIDGWRNSPFPEIQKRYKNLIDRLDELDKP